MRPLPALTPTTRHVPNEDPYSRPPPLPIIAKGKPLGRGWSASASLPGFPAVMLPRPLVPPQVDCVLRRHRRVRGERCRAVAAPCLHRLTVTVDMNSRGSPKLSLRAAAAFGASSWDIIVERAVAMKSPCRAMPDMVHPKDVSCRGARTVVHACRASCSSWSATLRFEVADS